MNFSLVQMLNPCKSVVGIPWKAKTQKDHVTHHSKNKNRLIHLFSDAEKKENGFETQPNGYPSHKVPKAFRKLIYGNNIIVRLKKITCTLKKRRLPNIQNRSEFPHFTLSVNSLVIFFSGRQWWLVSLYISFVYNPEVLQLQKEEISVYLLLFSWKKNTVIWRCGSNSTQKTLAINVCILFMGQ